MKRKINNFWLMLLCFFWLIPSSVHSKENSEIDQLKVKIQEQESLIQKQQSSIEQLVLKVSTLEAKIEGKLLPQPGVPERVALIEEEVPKAPSEEISASVSERPWFRHIYLSGFGAGGFVWTGEDASKAHSSFLNYEATLFVDAEVWEKVHYFHEIQTIRLGQEDTPFIRTREVYAHFLDPFKSFLQDGEFSLNLKIGRVDIPFGEDYLMQDIIDNPLITLPAAFAYGVDEGIVIYGKAHQVNWMVGVMDGTDERAFDDHSDKFVSLRLSGYLTDQLYWSLSGYRNGKAEETAFEYGGIELIPVGSEEDLISSAGESPSEEVDAYSFEVDSKYIVGFDRYLKLQFGYTYLDDGVSRFDREFYYFQVEPKWNLGPVLNNQWYLVARFSVIGTFDDEKGYAFPGEPFAEGDEAFGFDTKALYRWAFGLGYWPNPNTLLKMEYSFDDFRVISDSVADASHEERDFLGLIAALRF